MKILSDNVCHTRTNVLYVFWCTVPLNWSLSFVRALFHKKNVSQILLIDSIYLYVYLHVVPERVCLCLCTTDTSLAIYTHTVTSARTQFVPSTALPSSLHLLAPILHNYPEGCASSLACSGPTVTPFSGQQWTGTGPVRSDYRQVWHEVNLLCPGLCQHAHTLPLFITLAC